MLMLRMAGTTMGRIMKVSMSTPTKRAKPYCSTTRIFGTSWPAKEIVMMTPAVVITPAVRPTARLEAARSDQPSSRNSRTESMR
jgi:hypothetical protein